MTKLTKGDIEEIVELYQGGASLREVEQTTGSTRTTILKYLRLAGVETRPVGEPPKHEDKATAIAAQYRRGISARRIAELKGVSYPTVTRYLRVQGVEIRERRPKDKRRRDAEYRARRNAVRDALLAKIEYRGECWHWTGGATSHDIPRIMVNGKIVFPHRWLYERRHKMKLPSEVLLTRTCDDSLCVNPSHWHKKATDPWERALGKLAVDRDTYCWLIPGGELKARLNHSGTETYANRLAWKEWIGPIPEGKQVWRRCGNRRCVNPDHLYLRDNASHIGEIHHDPLVTDLRCKHGHLVIGGDRTPGGCCRVCRRVLDDELLQRAEDDQPMNPRQVFRERRAAQLEAERQAEAERQIAALLGVRL
jgi:hypothetical protein